MTITEFLLARIAEDEQGAQAATGHRVNWLRMCDSIAERTDADVGLFVNDHDPTRVLAECEAKRRIVTLMGYVRESWENTHSGQGRVMWPDINRREKHHALTILELLAAVHADHPDYREEWRS